MAHFQCLPQKHRKNVVQDIYIFRMMSMLEKNLNSNKNKSIELSVEQVFKKFLAIITTLIIQNLCGEHAFNF